MRRVASLGGLVHLLEFRNLLVGELEVLPLGDQVADGIHRLEVLLGDEGRRLALRELVPVRGPGAAVIAAASLGAGDGGRDEEQYEPGNESPVDHESPSVGG